MTEKNKANKNALSYFISLHEPRPDDSQEFSPQRWDQRAEFWKKERIKKRKGDERVISDISYLEEKGLLQKHFDVADIGCGPGRFVAAFARRVHRAVGLDISEKMIAHGMEYLKEEQLTNASLHTCDFQSLDLDKEGYRKAFDLVFSSMTPALRGMDNLKKSMEMSRGWCCHVTHLSGRNYLREQILWELFGKKPVSPWNGQSFYALFNILFLSGYNPETTYESRRQEIWVTPDEEYVDFLMEHMLPQEEITKAHAKQIRSWLQRHQNQEGQLLEISETTYGRLLWDVRNPMERPDYHPVSSTSSFRHVFLTGPKQIGKSTVIRQILSKFSGSVGGFYTVKMSGYLDSGFSVHLFSPKDPVVPTEENFLFACGKPDKNSDLRFNQMGSRILRHSADCSLILMDELGPHEAGAKEFRQAVFDTLDGPVPVLGVLQAPADTFWPDIVSRPDVLILEVSEENCSQEALIRRIEAELLRK